MGWALGLQGLGFRVKGLGFRVFSSVVVGICLTADVLVGFRWQELLL